MEAFITTYVIPGFWIIFQSVLMLVCLLLITAYILYADRKIFAAVQMCYQITDY